MKKKRLNLPLCQTAVTIITVVVTVIVILLMTKETFKVSGRYNRLINENYININYMNRIIVSLYRHEATIYRQFTLLENDDSDPVRTEADMLKSDIMTNMNEFGLNVKGTPYEPYYHAIQSSCANYFKTVDYVYDFLNCGDKATAKFYMDQTLNTDLTVVNTNITALYDMTYNDMNNAKNSMDSAVKYAYISSILFSVLLVTLGIISILITRMLSNSIAYRDSLTKTGNQEAIMRTGQSLFRKGKLWRYAFISLSIKDFKYFNNNLGAEAGDHILVNYAAKILDFLQSDEYIGRSGGDNFMILIKKDRIEQFLEFIRYMDIKMGEEENETFSTVYTRCGIYRIQKEDDITTSLNRANLALFKARTSPNTDFIFYTEEMAESIIDEKNISAEFRKALANGEFEVLYQPRVDIKENTLCGAEALVRWNKDGKQIMPDDFLTALENDGCITDLDLYVFERVCHDMREWMDADLGIVRISSNFSELNLKRPDFIETIVDCIDRYDISKSLLELEFPANCREEDSGTLKRYTDELRNRNIHISLDQFGSGYSSPLLVKELNINGVKLGRSLLQDMEENNQDNMSANMYKHIAHIAKDLGRRVVSVGVETYEQVEFLRSINCNIVQGLYYDRPLTKDEFAKRLTNKRYQD